MKRLVPIREELLRGDLRNLYIGWLATLAKEMIDDEESEPLSSEGLGSLTPAQHCDQVSFVHISFSAFVFDLVTEAEIQHQENETLSGRQKVRQAGVSESVSAHVWRFRLRLSGICYARDDRPESLYPFLYRVFASKGGSSSGRSILRIPE